MALRAAELEVLVTVNDDQVAKSEKNIKATGQRVEKNPMKVDADAKGALASFDRVEAEAKKIVSQRTMATVDANIERAEKQFTRVYERLDYLRSVETELDVSADIRRAEAAMQKVERQLDGLRSAKATMEVDLDTAPAEEGFRRTRDVAGKSGDDAGSEFSDSVIAALVSIPIAGAVIGIGAAAAKALISGFQDGLAQEQGRDRLQALTGITESEALTISRAAGEAYASNFGESVEANMNSARLGVQYGIIDAKASTRDAQLVIQNLAGIADVLEEDVRPAALAVSTMIKTGIAKNSQEAFDILAAGARNGANRAEDLLDTFTEYPALFARLGLTGGEALGLVNQGLEAGARNSDLVADALKEFQIRATDASDASAEAFEALGLNAEEMTAKIARGGQDARDGLDIVLDKLRETEDPVLRNAAAVGLFGTQAEDLGSALFALDLSSAVEQLDGVAGSAQRMFDTLASNDASKIETARRNIEVAVDGIQGALATAFSEPLGDFADWVSQNRGPLLQFFSDMLNGALDFVEGSTYGFGQFVSGPLADTVDGLAGVIDFFNGMEGRPTELDNLAESMRGFDEKTETAVVKLQEMREQFNGFADAQIALGYVNDTSLILADSISKVGDGTATMESQVRNAISALYDQVTAAEAAGEGQDGLTTRLNDGTQALVDQMVQSGMTEEAARQLIDQVMQTPTDKKTTFDTNAPGEKDKVQALADRITTLPDGSATITVSTAAALERIREVQAQISAINFFQPTGTRGRPSAGGTFAHGAVLEFMHQGGIPGLTPMQPIAQMVPPNTWRVVGDRGDVPELYAPLDGSLRSWSLLMEGLRRMPGSPPELMGRGGLTGPGAQGFDVKAFAVELGRIIAAHPRVHITEINPVHTDPMSERWGRALNEDAGGNL